MGRSLKVGGYAAGVLVFLLAVGITATVGWRPFVGPSARPLTARRFEPTRERMERGQYLVEGVLACFACHSRLDPKRPQESYAAAHKGAGAPMELDGMPWLVASNITPDVETGAGGWSDDALARGIREGVGHDGRALFPAMPYRAYSALSDEDLASIIVYLRTIRPAHNPLPKSEIPFPLSRLINGVPRPLTEPVPPPDSSSPARRGEYLARIADCAGCHTPRDDRGRPIAALAYGGGNKVGPVATANITPDPTGISYYDEATFLGALKEGHVGARRLSPAMPSWIYRNMNDDDLRDMFAYLRTLAPARHLIDNTEPPTPCKLCKQEHGLGDKN